MVKLSRNFLFIIGTIIEIEGLLLSEKSLYLYWTKTTLQ